MQILAGVFSSSYQFSKMNVDQGLSELKDGFRTSFGHLISAIVYPCGATSLALGRTLNLFHHLNNWNVESNRWD